MNIRFHSPVLFVEDLPKERHFYENVLQQEVDFDFGACILFKCGLSIWKPAAEHIVSQYYQSKLEEKGKNQIELCFETEEFENLYERVKSLNLDFLHDRIEEPWGQITIRFFDPEKNLVEIGESTPCFVYRMFTEGMSVHDISSKTGIIPEQVELFLGI